MKYVFFLENTHYYQNVHNATRGQADVYAFSGFRSKLEKSLFKIHNAWPINKHMELPGKSIWFRRVLRENELSSTEKNCFLFFEPFHLSYSGKYLRYLKKKFPNSKFCFMFTNPAGEYNLTKLNAVRKYYDSVVAFSKYDAEKYGFLFCETGMYDPKKIEESDLRESDIFFIGADKGRLELLLKIYEKATAEGLRCDFFITGVPEEKQRYAENITYNHPIPYEEALQHLDKTKCVLEVLQDGNAYCSIRTMEAYAYRKKLLTVNYEIEKTWFYDDRIVQVVRDPKDIVCDFVLRDVPEEVYKAKEFYTFAAYRRFLEENVMK